MLRPLDVVTALNLGLFAAAIVLRLWDRWLRYRGPGNLAEFLVYAAVIAALFLVAWYGLRKAPWSWGLVMLIEAPVLLHFAGVLVPVDGGRLFDLVVLGIRFDKLVHLLSAAAIAFTLRRVFAWREIRLGSVAPLVIMLVVMGLGAAWEIVEYFVVRTIPDAGVGEYANNLQDLVANAIGAGIAVVLDRSRVSQESR